MQIQCGENNRKRDLLNGEKHERCVAFGDRIKCGQSSGNKNRRAVHLEPRKQNYPIKPRLYGSPCRLSTVIRNRPSRIGAVKSVRAKLKSPPECSTSSREMQTYIRAWPRPVNSSRRLKSVFKNRNPHAPRGWGKGVGERLRHSSLRTLNMCFFDYYFAMLAFALKHL